MSWAEDEGYDGYDLDDCYDNRRNEMSDIEFVSGLYVDKPHEKAPDFVKCKISIKRKELGNWLRSKEDEYINIDVKESKDGKWYAAVNNWKPEKKADEPAPQADDFSDDIPFMRIQHEYVR